MCMRLRKNILNLFYKPKKPPFKVAFWDPSLCNNTFESQIDYMLLGQ